MITSMRWVLLLLLLPLVAACQAAPSAPHDLDWGHMVGGVIPPKN